MKKQLAINTTIAFFLLVSMNVSSQQNVGIGTASPSFRLDVQGDAASTLLTNINSKVNYSGTLDIKAVEGISVTNAGYGIGGRFTGGYKGVDALCQGGAYSSIPLYGVYGNATGTAGTRAGIYGTASGGSANYGVWGFVNGGVNHYGVYGQNTNSSGYAGYFDGRGYFSNDLNAFDKVGIGFSAAPNTKLQILGGSDCSLSSNGFVQFGATNSWNLILDDNEILARNNGEGNDLFVQNDGGNVLLCSSKLGGVGIGITTGSLLANGYLLSVDGKIIAEEMRIQNFTNWPDYVFEPNYKRMSFEELKQSIAQNKHLPNVPSALEVKENGIMVGDMQKKLTEKIEELTLYILDLNETNKKQQAEIDQLKSEIVTRQP
jgi:hypothetical protein